MVLTPLAAWYLFCLGMAVGATGLAITAYLSVSPRWLRWLLVLSGLFVVSRYLTMLLLASSTDPTRWWALRRCWLATSVGLTFPSLVAVDQLVRHPAMSPKKLVKRFAPFLVIYLGVFLFGEYRLVPDELIGMRVTLGGFWRGVLLATQSVFVLGFVGLGGLLVKKLPVRRIRVALLGLLAAQLYLGCDGLVLGLGGWYFRPFLFSELLTLVAIWFALNTARTQTL